MEISDELVVGDEFRQPWPTLEGTTLAFPLLLQETQAATGALHR